MDDERMEVMLDLETMGLSMNSAIIQVGAITFDRRHSFSCNVALQSCLMVGMTADPSTLKWWQAQGELAKASLCTQPILSLQTALFNFSTWWNELPGLETPLIWSHGAAFDVPLLDQAYELCKQACPWAYQDVRDTRTVFAMAKAKGWKPVQLAEQLRHNAIADCHNQINNVQSALKWLEGV